MNKKLFAMMMVPVVVVMGGTFAFSAWSGSANAFFNSQAATVGYTETLSFVHTNASVNPITISNGHSSNSVTSSTGMYIVDSQSGGAASTLNVYANGTGLVPGDYVEFQVNITNTGTAVLNTSLVSVNSVAVYNSNGQLITGNEVPISELQPSVTQAYLNSVVNTGNYGNGVSDQGVGYLINATSSGSSPASLSPGQSLTYSVYVILPMTAPGSVAGTGLSVSISIPISVDQ